MSVNISQVQNIQNLVKLKQCQFMAVTKNRSTEDIEELKKLNVKIYGENRILEAEKKYSQLIERDQYELHLIGPIQSNKLKVALQTFDVIQTIDRIKIIDLITQYSTIEHRAKKFYIQINIGEEQQKSGVRPDDTKGLYQYAISKNLNIVGLMCIPPNNEETISYFKKMKKIRDDLNNKLLLSMGMSGDYEAAMENGSNLIRVGSLLFNG